VSCQAQLAGDDLALLHMQRSLHQAPQLKPAANSITRMLAITQNIPLKLFGQTWHTALLPILPLPAVIVWLSWLKSAADQIFGWYQAQVMLTKAESVEQEHDSQEPSAPALQPTQLLMSDDAHSLYTMFQMPSAPA